MVSNVEIKRIHTKHVADLIAEDLEGVIRARIPRGDNAAHVGVNVVRFVTVTKLHFIKSFRDFDVIGGCCRNIFL
ncbi:MAG: hypothetical protein ACKPKO_16955 [Candidatus Fonsibacter sp.]